MNTSEIIAEAVRTLKEGGLILYPTDTVWGIGCDATNPVAVAKVFALKKRSDSKSLVLLACDMDMVARYVRRIPDIAIDLVEVNDKPMTLIYPDAQYLAPEVVAEDGSVGIRIPMSAFCVEMVRRFRRPVVSTSANISGCPTPSRFDEIDSAIVKGVDYVVPESIGTCATGVASQIIKVELDGQVKIIRA
ncbi:MAG: threonylcarbamoyl-AMP synthase [Bacteroidales bacterium]|nr:threonylcarbamoyl-AMP synthase [Bacteroidales bacterium]